MFTSSSVRKRYTLELTFERRDIYEVGSVITSDHSYLTTKAFPTLNTAILSIWNTIARHFNTRNKQLKVFVWDTGFSGCDVLRFWLKSTLICSVSGSVRSQNRTVTKPNEPTNTLHQHLGSNKRNYKFRSLSRYLPRRTIQEWTDLLFLKPNIRHLACSFSSPQIWGPNGTFPQHRKASESYLLEVLSISLRC